MSQLDVVRMDKVDQGGNMSDKQSDKRFQAKSIWSQLKSSTLAAATPCHYQFTKAQLEKA